MNKNMNRSAQVASEQFQALAHQERAMLDSVLAAIKSAFSNEPETSRSLSAIKHRGEAISHSVLATVNRHPIATALSFVGLGCLLYGLRGRGSSEDWNAYHQSRASYGVDPEYIDEWGEPIPASERVGSPAKGKLKEARERAEELGPRAREYARDARSRAAQMAGGAQGSAESLSHNLQGRSQDLAQKARTTIRQHPVAAGIVGVALGVAVGGALYGSSRNKASFHGFGRRASDRNFSRAGSFFSNTSNAAKDAVLNAKGRITH